MKQQPYPYFEQGKYMLIYTIFDIAFMIAFHVHLLTVNHLTVAQECFLEIDI